MVGARERASIGASAASTRERAARGEALALAFASALAEVNADASAFSMFAAGNLDFAAKPLLEAYGQGARGLVRTRAWILRNGAQLERGSRGYAISAWGWYAFPLTMATRRFGGYGPMSGPAPAEEVEGFEMLTGDALAARILVAMLGYDPPPLGERSVTVQSLERSLALARGIAWQTTCLGCLGDSCVLCSCQDDAKRQPLLDYSAVESPRKPVGRPAKTLADPSAVKAAFARVHAAEAELAEARRILRETVKAANESASLRSIADAAGVSFQRVHQIIQKGER